jgi:hypothetical protein
LIGTLRRECLDHLVIVGEAHLRRILTAYAAYYKSVGLAVRAGNLYSKPDAYAFDCQAEPQRQLDHVDQT